MTACALRLRTLIKILIMMYTDGRTIKNYWHVPVHFCIHLWLHLQPVEITDQLEFYGTHTRCAVVAWDSAHSWRRLQVRQLYTFALLTMVIALCTIKHLWIWTCWTNCTVFFMSIFVDFFLFKFVLLDNFCSCCYYNYIASLTSYWTKLYCTLAACSLYHTGVMLEQNIASS